MSKLYTECLEIHLGASKNSQFVSYKQLYSATP